MTIIPMTIERQFTIKEVANMLKVDPRTIRRWIQNGRLIVVKIPGRGPSSTEYRVPKSSIEAIGFNVIEPEAKESES